MYNVGQYKQKHLVSVKSLFLPVRIDWSTLSVVDLIEVNLMSAGTLSPTMDRNNKAQETLKYHLRT